MTDVTSGVSTASFFIAQVVSNLTNNPGGAAVSSATTSSAQTLYSAVMLSTTLQSLAAGGMLNATTGEVTVKSATTSSSSSHGSAASFVQFVPRPPRNFSPTYYQEMTAVIACVLLLFSLLLLFVVEAFILRRHNEKISKKLLKTQLTTVSSAAQLLASSSTNCLNIAEEKKKKPRRTIKNVVADIRFSTFETLRERLTGGRHSERKVTLIGNTDCSVRYCEGLVMGSPSDEHAEPRIKFTIGSHHSDCSEENINVIAARTVNADVSMISPNAPKVTGGCEEKKALQRLSDLGENNYGVDNPGFEPEESKSQPAVLVIEQEVSEYHAVPPSYDSLSHL